MKNKTILIGIICLLLIPLATAYYSGDTFEVYHKDTCEEVTINITNSSLVIEDGEYSFDPCELITNNFWECNCSDDGITILMTTTLSTINEYELLIDGWYYTTTSPSPSPPPSNSGSGGGSSSGGRCDMQDYLKISTNKCVKGCITSEPWYLRNGYKVGCGANDTQQQNQTQTIDTPEDQEEDPQDEVDEIVEEPKEKSKGIYFWVIGIIIVVGILIYTYIKIPQRRKI